MNNAARTARECLQIRDYSDYYLAPETSLLEVYSVAPEITLGGVQVFPPDIPSFCATEGGIDGR